MFEFFFHYPRTAFSKGEVVLLAGMPVWVLGLLVVVAAAGLAWVMRLRMPEAAVGIKGWRPAVIWVLQSAMVTLVLVLLWKPALLISELKPQQNIVAVVVDDSRSMAQADVGKSRRAQAVEALEGGLLKGLEKKFQVRLYRSGAALQRINKLEELKSEAPATRLGESLKQIAAESAGLPIGAVLLLSDGSDNAGGIDLETVAELRSRRLPIHTIGFGKERAERDLEISDVQVAPRTLADSRLAAQVSFHQSGYAGQKAKLTVKDGGKVLASQMVTLAPDGKQQSETVLLNSGTAGAKTLSFTLEGLTGEENGLNNAVSRLVNVESGKRRILYIEGEPRWEFKFIRRAKEKDRAIQLVSMLRTTQNKIYRQEIENPSELLEGFPSRVEEMLGYHALVIGSVEAGYFTAAQQELIKQFVDRRGGGLLFLGGRSSLSDGGYGQSALTDLLPVTLPDRKGTFQREPAAAELTPAGADSLICRLVEEPGRNTERWKKLPALADYQDVGAPKPGAVVLAGMTVGNRTLPLLITQNYGRGRTAVLATGGTWRWQMSQALEDQTHEMFWQQLMRWLAAETPGRLVSSTPQQILFDNGRLVMNAEVRDRNFLPAADARVEARILGPEGLAAQVELRPDAANPGSYQMEWEAEKTGSYLVEVMAKRGEEEMGRDVLTFQRQDGVAENFRTNQNKELLEKLSAQTGGEYWRPSDLEKLAREISYSEAGITVRQTKDLWNMPVVFLLLLLLRGSEWILRRKWGAV
ncbi:MAG: hypothetical protein JJE04_21565 [Acidobacteriia bacterium]|nr:hypothetical protein [Terriglobia bacterium]